MRNWKHAVIAVALMLGISCARPTFDPNQVNLVLSFGLDTQLSALAFQQMTHFRLRIYAGPTDSATSKTVFDSECLEYRGDNFEINDIEVGADRVIFFEGFTDAGCTKRSVVGSRGGVSVEKNTKSDGFYYLHLGETGKFSVLPTPSSTEVSNLNKLACSGDATCKVVNPAAFCRTDKVCDLASYFPLNVDVGRAFHSATVIDDGRIVFAGGLTVRNDLVANQYKSTTIVEVFDPHTMLFAKPQLNDNAPGYAFHSSVSLGNNQMMVLGGINQIRFTIKSGAVDVLPDLPAQGCEKDSCLTNLVRIFDLKRLGVNSNNTLPAPLMSAVVERLDRSSAPKIFVGSGITSSGNSYVNTDTAYICKFGADSNDCTQNSVSLAAKRRGAAGFCAEKTGDDCKKYVIYGGNELANQPLMEGVAVADASRYAVTSSGDDVPQTAFGSQIVQAAGVFYVFGGVEGTGNPNILPRSISLSGATATLKKLTLNGLAENKTYRVYHQLISLGDGRVLMMGGLDYQGKPTTSVLVFLQGQFVAELQLNQARFGHSATVLTSGLLKGAILLVGGFKVVGTELKPVMESELFFPE